MLRWFGIEKKQRKRQPVMLAAQPGMIGAPPAVVGGQGAVLGGATMLGGADISRGGAMPKSAPMPRDLRGGLAVSQPAMPARRSGMFQCQQRPRPVSTEELQTVAKQGGCTPLKVGEGSFGSVVLVRGQGKQLWACKVVRHPRMHDFQIAEARIIRDVLGNDHHRIARGWRDRWAVGPLRHILRGKPGKLLPEGFLWHVLSQAAEGHLFCHNGVMLPSFARAQGWTAPVVHGDVKPDNMLLRFRPGDLNSYPEVVLSDFGISVCVTDPTYSPRLAHGTDAFIAPEQQFTFEADMYAPGATIHAVALGTTPIDTEPRRNILDPQRPVKVDRSGNQWHLEGSSRRCLSLQPLYSETLDWTMRQLLVHRPEMRWTARNIVEMMNTEHIQQIRQQTFRPLASWTYEDSLETWMRAQML